MPQPSFRSVALYAVVGIGALVALILLSPRRQENRSSTPDNVLPPPALPSPTSAKTFPLVASHPAAFTTWELEADHFLQQTWRTSRYSAIAANVSSLDSIPSTTASFDHLIDVLPPANLWRELPAITRARLSAPLPKTSAETLAWTDQRLLHLWALVLNLPATRHELRSTLDEMRTVRWLVQNNLIAEIPGHELDREFAERLGNLDQKLRPRATDDHSQLPAAETWREVARQAAQSPAERVREEVGEEMYSRLRAISSRARRAELLSRAVPFGLGGSDRDPTSVNDPVASALFSYGPLPHAANAALGLDVPGAPSDDIVKIPELLPELSEQEARPLVAAALAAKASLDWTDAPRTLVFTAQNLANGSLHDGPAGLRYFLSLMMAAWPEPVVPRAEAGLALLTTLTSAAGKNLLPDDAADAVEVYRQYRGLCLVALGRGREADAVLGENEFRQWEALEALPASTAAGVAEFSLLRLARQPGTSSRWWELMEAKAKLAGRAADALALMKAKQKQIDGDTTALLINASEDAGQFEEAAALVLEDVRKPYDSSGMAPTQRRADLLWELLTLGEEHHRPNWTREALTKLDALMTYWMTERDGSSDGGEPWEKWPGKLVELNRLDLALSAAKLNVRWHSANSDFGRVFLMPETERTKFIVNGPAGAMTGLVQILALQKKPQEVIDYLGAEDSWPARDLHEIALVFDPSFSAERRRTLGSIVVDALAALGRRDEAARVQSSLKSEWKVQLRAFLASDVGANLAKEKRLALEYVLTNELPADATVDLVDIAFAAESAPIVMSEQSFPRDVFPLTAAAARLNLQLGLGDRVPIPPIENLRTHIVSSAAELAPVRDALLANVPNP